MNTPLTLESVQSEFHHWRQQKTSARSPVPPHLREKALALRADFGPSQVTKALGISHNMLKSWSGEKVKKSTEQRRQLPESIEFATIPLADDNASPRETTKLCCELPGGQRWCLQGDFTTGQLHAFIQSLHQIAGGRP